MTNSSNKRMGTAMIFASYDLLDYSYQYFEVSRSLLPLLDKPLVQEIVECIDEVCDNVLLVISESGREPFELETYQKVFSKQKNVYFVGQDRSRRSGTFRALEIIRKKKIKCISAQNKEKELAITFPLLVIHGNIFFDEDLLSDFLSTLDHINSPNIVWCCVDVGPYGESRNDGMYNHVVINDYENIPCQRSQSLVIEGSQIKNIFFGISNRSYLGLDKHPYFVDSGIYLLSEEGFDELMSYGAEVLPYLIGHLPLSWIFKLLLCSNREILHCIIPSSGNWVNVYFPWDILIARDLATSKYTKKVDENKYSEYVVIRDIDKSKGFSQNMIHISEEVRLDGVIVTRKEHKLEIHPNVHIRGACFFGDNCVVHPFSCIANSSIGRNSEVFSHSFIENSIVMDHSKIFHQSIISHSVIGSKTIFGPSSIACSSSPKSNITRLMGATRFFEYAGNLGAIIGNRTKIGMGARIYPRKKIGKDCTIFPGYIVFNDILSDTVARLEGGGI